ncbi:MAG: PspC domain-containing protein [Anaerolineae bacterium]|nr:PspC domain-containing protein [Anaerolineae bacterium]
MKKLYRSRSDEMIAGVCGGLADYFEIDPAIIRLLFVLLLFAGTGGFWIYIILWIVMPLQPENIDNSIDVKEKPAASSDAQTIDVKPVEEKSKEK